MLGTVRFFNIDKRYGFIAPDDGGSDSFVHMTAVQAAGMQTLTRNQRLSYDVKGGRDGHDSAVNLAPVAKEELNPKGTQRSPSTHNGHSDKPQQPDLQDCARLPPTAA